MFIEFKKAVGKHNILTCIRSDDSRTWTKMHPGIEAHDLAHYAVETVLGFQNAFYGLVAEGHNIEDFELPRDKRPTEVMPKNLTNEALVTEHLVNLLMVKAQNNDGSFDLINSLKSILIEKRIPFPKNLDLGKLQEIWGLFQELLQRWNELPSEDSIILEFVPHNCE